MMPPKRLPLILLPIIGLICGGIIAAVVYLATVAVTEGK